MHDDYDVDLNGMEWGIYLLPSNKSWVNIGDILLFGDHSQVTPAGT